MQTDEHQTPTEPSLRAFASGTGLVFQYTGFAYLGIAGFYWFASGRLDPPSAVPVETLADYFAPANVTFAITTANVLAGVVGGLAVFALGLGLQAEKRQAAIGGIIVSLILELITTTSAVLFITAADAWGRAVVVAIISLMNIVLLMLAGRSLVILNAHPPPPDDNEVDSAWIEEYHRNRRRPFDS
jgi:lysylphosphatidylglycerol synthetase-like protein (DUF2156 family)